MYRKENNLFARSELVDAAVYNNLKTELYHSFSDEDISVLKHHGILGMKWGIRRYQNEDGTLTDEGKRRYGAGNPKNVKKARDIYMSSGASKDVTNEVFKSLNADTSSLDKVRNDIKTAFVEKKKNDG